MGNLWRCTGQHGAEMPHNPSTGANLGILFELGVDCHCMPKFYRIA